MERDYGNQQAACKQLQAACFDVEAISWQQQDSIVCDTFLRLGQGLAC